MGDLQAQLQQSTQEAYHAEDALRIVGGGSRPFLPHSTANRSIHTADHCGVLEYQPEELVITLRSGTPLAEAEQLLAKHRQRLPFAPPRFSDHSTIGGAVATGLAGPSRPWSGGVRDYLLGAKILTGEGSILQLGGAVVKNVAGYDLFRPMVGSYGTLGLLLELSIRTLPIDEQEACWSRSSSQTEAYQVMEAVMQLNLPITGLSWYQQQLHLRLSGIEAEITSAATLLQANGFNQEPDTTFWHQLQHQQLPFFDKNDPIWRVSLPPVTPPLHTFEDSPDTELLIDWGGAQRWICGNLPADALRSRVAEQGGHAMLYRNPTGGHCRFHPLAPPLQKIQLQLQQLLNPHTTLNPGIFPLRDDPTQPCT